MYGYSTIIRACGFVVLCCLSQWSYASVILMGNRIIYPAQGSGKTLQFTNNDNTPALVQIWLENQHKQAASTTIHVPFTVTPPIFRVNPHSGQTVRLVFTGQSLPRDRESLFYFNFLQVPAIQKQHDNQNRFTFIVTNRLKLFYRPTKLVGEANQVNQQLQVKWRKNQLQVINPTPYYANVSQATLIAANQRANIAQADMIAPYSQVNWPLPLPVKANQTLQLKLAVINDYGAATQRTLRLTQ